MTQFSSVPWPTESLGGFSSLVSWCFEPSHMRDDSAESFSLFCRPSWAVLAWAGTSTLWRCPYSFTSADHGVARPPRCPEGWVLLRNAKPCEFWFLDSCQKRLLWEQKEADLAPNSVVCLVHQAGNAEKFPQALGLEYVDPFLRVSKRVPCLTVI